MNKYTKREKTIGYVVVLGLAMSLTYLGNWLMPPEPDCYDEVSSVSEYVACFQMDAKVFWADMKAKVYVDDIW